MVKGNGHGGGSDRNTGRAFVVAMRRELAMLVLYMNKVKEACCNTLDWA